MPNEHRDAYKVVYAHQGGLEAPHHGKAYLLLLHIATAQAFLWNSFLAGVIWLVRNLVGKKTTFKGALWALGRSRFHHSSPLVDLFSGINHTMKVDATRQPALNLCYHWDEVAANLKKERKWIELYFARMFFGTMANRRALANRRIIVIRTLLRAFRALRDAGVGDITMISIASGSADAVIEAVRRARDEESIRVNVTLIDLDKQALSDAQKNARAQGLEEQFHVRHGTARTTFLTLVKDEGMRPHVVEMVGFLDYRNDDYVVRLSGDIYAALAPGGYYLTCNIAPNTEKRFLDWVLLWLMPFYRTERAFTDLIAQTPFIPDDITVIRDPYFDIHTQVLCHKKSEAKD